MASPAIGKPPEEGLEEHAGEGGDREDKTNEKLTGSQGSGKERQQRSFSHLVSGTDNQICQRDGQKMLKRIV
jgi:hypothetical protein